MTDREKAEGLVRRYYDAFNRDDVAGMLACVARDVVHDANQGSRRAGKEAFAVFCRHMQECYRERLEDVVVMGAADGRRAAAEFIVRGSYLRADAGMPEAHGQHYVLPAGAFLEIGNGLITRVTTYYNLQSWLTQISGQQKRG